MIKIKAEISLVDLPNGRENPIRSGYRPHFLFPKGEMTSGSIDIEGEDMLALGETKIVEVRFLFRELLGPEFAAGAKFSFFEGRYLAGEGKVIEVLSNA